MDVNELLRKLRSRFSIAAFTETSDTKIKGTKEPFDGSSPEDIFWVDAFHQVYVENHSNGRDDLLFFVKWDSKQNCELVEVFRKDTVSLPSARDESVLWEKTLYLNLLLHEFEYYVTCGVLTVKPDSDNVDEVKVKVEQQLYPSPSQRRMDKKDSLSEVVYPNIMFCVDNFEDVFSNIYSTTPGDKIAVQLVAVNKAASLRQLVFLGAIDHTTLKGAYEYKDQQARYGSLSSKLKKFSLKSRNSRVFDLTFPHHFLRMRGPGLKGFAEVAIRKHDLNLAELQTYRPHSSSSSSEKTPTSSEHFFGSSETNQTSGSEGGELAHQASVVSAHEITNNDNAQGSWLNDSEDKLNTEPDKTAPSNHDASLQDCDNGQRDVAVAAKDSKGGLKAKLKSLRQFPRKYKQSASDSESSNSLRVYGYLTYVQLPWYTLVEDILNSTKEEVM